MKRKDALTDLVEHAQDREPSAPQSPSLEDGQVVNSEGEVITLGYGKGTKVRILHKGKYLELPLEVIERIVRQAVDRALKDFGERLLQKVKEKLAEKD